MCGCVKMVRGATFGMGWKVGEDWDIGGMSMFKKAGHCGALIGDGFAGTGGGAEFRELECIGRGCGCCAEYGMNGLERWIGWWGGR